MALPKILPLPLREGLCANPSPHLVRFAAQVRKGRGSKRRWLIPLPPIYNNGRSANTPFVREATASTEDFRIAP